MAEKLVIAIDGYSSCGKSTVAKELAKRLNYIYIDSGAMYRAVTLFVLQNNLVENEQINTHRLIDELDNIDIKFEVNPATNNLECYLNGVSIEKEIRSIEVSGMVSPVSKLSFVRERMVDLQREMGANKGIVMDGRDIGTVVFPDADLKVFMTANAEVRARRRYDELKEKGIEASFKEVLANINSRDHIDSTRETSPLRQAEDAIILDNSELTREQQLTFILELAEGLIANKNAN